MKTSTLTTPLALCLLGVGLVACGGDNGSSTTGGPVAALQTPSPSDRPPLSNTRTAVTRGALPPSIGDRVFFAYDSSLLSPDSQRVLQSQAAWLKSAPPGPLVIEGHADERGTREYNIGLGERRAQAVRRALMLQGVAESQLTTVSFGAERPAAEGDDETAWAKNRRVELVYGP